MCYHLGLTKTLFRYLRSAEPLFRTLALRPPTSDRRESGRSPVSRESPWRSSFGMKTKRYRPIWAFCMKLIRPERKKVDKSGLLLRRLAKK